RFAGGVLLNGNECGHAAAFGEDFADAVAGAFGGDERDVDVGGRVDGAEADVEAVREHQGLGLAVGAFGLQAGLDLLVDLRGGLVGNEEHDGVGPLGGFGGAGDFEAGELGLFGVGGAGAQADLDLHARVLE